MTAAYAMLFREDLEWSGGASRAPPCTVGYLAEAEPSLETACCQAAEAHSHQLVESLTNSDHKAEAKAEGKAEGRRSLIKPEQMGAAGISNAPCTVLVSQCSHDKRVVGVIRADKYTTSNQTLQL